MTDPIVNVFDVDCPIEHAFSVWAESTSLWWPASHSMSGAPDSVILEPRVGGRIFERAGGEDHEWGRVLAWEPPARLAYSWHHRTDATDAADATEVEITFAPAAGGGATQVTIVHRGWERLGAAGARLRERDVRVWPSVLSAYRAAI